MITENAALAWPCVECNKRLNESEMFEFGGTVACERCVRAFYEERNSKDPDIQWDIELEVRTRRNNAIAWVRRNRRKLETYAKKFGY